MSGKIIPAIVAAVLIVGTAASAQSPSGQDAGNIASDALAAHSGYSGGPGFYYDYAPGRGHPRRARIETAQPGKFGW